MSKSLEKLHASAHAIGQNALSAFHVIVKDLHAAADRHQEVADQAHEQIVALSDLRDSADSAAIDARRQAIAVKTLIS